MNFPSTTGIGGGPGAAMAAGLRSGTAAGLDIIRAQGGAQQQAIQAEQARIMNEKYVESKKPIRISDIAKNIPPLHAEPILKLAEMEGIIKKDDPNPFIEKGDWQNFLADFKKNDVKQAVVLKHSIDTANKKKEPLKKEYDALKPDRDKWEGTWRRMEAETYDEKTGQQNMVKLSALKKKMKTEEEYNAFLKKEGELKKAMTAIDMEIDRDTTGLNIKNDRHANLIKAYGMEDAIAIQNNWVTEDQVRQKQLMQKAMAPAQAKKLLQDTPTEIAAKSEAKQTGIQKAKVNFPTPTKPDKPRKDETPEGQVSKKIKGLESHIKVNYDTKIKENEKQLKDLDKKLKSEEITKEEYTRDKGVLEWNIKSNLAEKQKTVNYINQLRTQGTAPTAQTYKKGQIVKGKTGDYQFMGGNWEDRKNWKRVK